MLVNSLGLFRIPNRATIVCGRARRSASQIAHSTKALEKMSAPFPLRKRSMTNFLSLGSLPISTGQRPQPSQDSRRREAMISSVARMKSSPPYGDDFICGANVLGGLTQFREE